MKTEKFIYTYAPPRIGAGENRRRAHPLRGLTIALALVGGVVMLLALSVLA